MRTSIALHEASVKLTEQENAILGDGDHLTSSDKWQIREQTLAQPENAKRLKPYIDACDAQDQLSEKADAAYLAELEK